MRKIPNVAPGLKYGLFAMRSWADKVAGRKYPREKSIWCGVKQRTMVPTSHSYEDYGLIGIKMYHRWKDSFAAFMDDMGPAPLGYQLDREDFDGPYAPWNCRWVTPVENANNRMGIRMVTFRGETLPCSELARRYGKDANIFRVRLNLGWSVHKALFRKVKKYKK